MSLSLADFKIRFPDLKLDGSGDSDTFLQAHLDMAGRRINTKIWGDLADDGQGYLAAHLVAISPFGQSAKLSAKGKSTYGEEYKRLQKVVASGARVATTLEPMTLHKAGGSYHGGY